MLKGTHAALPSVVRCFPLMAQFREILRHLFYKSQRDWEWGRRDPDASNRSRGGGTR
jgi:hypothetical protein